MRLEHIGIAMADPSAIDLLSSLLGAAPYQSQTVEREGVRTVFFGDGGAPGAAPKLELLESLRPDSPVGAFLDRRGPGVHHLAFDVPDLPAAMDRVRALGIRLLADAPKPGADGKEIVFLHPKDTAGILVELCTDAPVAWEALRLPRGDGEVSVHAAGPADSPPLLAFHGANGAATQLRPMADRWARRFRVLAVDLSGHGGTPAAGPLSWSAFAADAVAVLDGLGLDDAHAFGYSMGGGVALALAAAHPERVRRLAVFATHVQWDAPLAGRFLADAAPDTQPEAVVETLRAWHGDGWRDVLARTEAFVRQLPSDPIADEALARVSHPTRVLHGDSDALFPVEHAVALYRVLPNARLLVLPGATHALGSLDAPAVARDIAEWLDDPGTP